MSENLRQFFAVVPVRYYTIVICIPSVFFLLLCWILPESPIWLMRRNREKKARKVIQWLRGNDYNIEPEMSDLHKILDEERNSRSTTIKDIIYEKTFLLPLLLICSSFTFQAMCGADFISYYTAIIFQDVGVKPEVAALINQVKVYISKNNLILRYY